MIDDPDFVEFEGPLINCGSSGDRGKKLSQTPVNLESTTQGSKDEGCEESAKDKKCMTFTSQVLKIGSIIRRGERNLVRSSEGGTAINHQIGIRLSNAKFESEQASEYNRTKTFRNISSLPVSSNGI